MMIKLRAKGDREWIVAADAVIHSHDQIRKQRDNKGEDSDLPDADEVRKIFGDFAVEIEHLGSAKHREWTRRLQRLEHDTALELAKLRKPFNPEVVPELYGDNVSVPPKVSELQHRLVIDVLSACARGIRGVEGVDENPTAAQIAEIVSDLGLGLPIVARAIAFQALRADEPFS